MRARGRPALLITSSEHYGDLTAVCCSAISTTAWFRDLLYIADTGSPVYVGDSEAHRIRVLTE